MFQAALLREQDVEPLAAGVGETLAAVGVLCQNPELLAALADFGARVDYAAQRVTFPAPLTAEFAAALRRETPAGEAAAPRFTPPGLAEVDTQIAPLYYDWSLRSARPAR